MIICSPARRAASPTRGILFAALAVALIAFNLAQTGHAFDHLDEPEQPDCEICLALTGNAITANEVQVAAQRRAAPPPATLPEPLFYTRLLHVQCRGPPDVSPL